MHRQKKALTTVDFTTVIEEAEMAALGQGRLSISVEAENAPPHYKVSGHITPRFSCDIFDSILSTSDSEQDSENSNSEETTHVVSTATASAVAASSIVSNSNGRGLSWMTMDRDGLVKYHLKLSDLDEQPLNVQIDNGRKSQRLLRIVHDFDFSSSSSLGGWSNGSFRMSAQDIDAFYHGNLYINVATSSNDRALRGRIVQNLMGLAQEFAQSPILLSANPPSTANVSGLAWINIDSTCRLHYHLRLHGVEKDTEAKILLEDHPMRNLKALNLVRGRRLDLQDFVGFEASGHQDSIHKLTMARMSAGDASVKVESAAFVSIEGRIGDVQIPTECLPRFSRNDLELMPGFLNDRGEEVPEAEKEYALKCVYEGTIYDDGSQWKATHEACKMCSCQRYYTFFHLSHNS